MAYDEQLQESTARLKRLKANVHAHALGQFVEHLRTKWQPKTREIDTPHGPATMYYDEYNHVWTIEDIAFKGYVFTHVARILNKNS